MMLQNDYFFCPGGNPIKGIKKLEFVHQFFNNVLLNLDLNIVFNELFEDLHY